MAELFIVRMPFLWDSLAAEPRLIRGMAHLLANTTHIGRQIADVLLTFVTDKKLEALTDPTSKVKSAPQIRCSDVPFHKR